MVSSLASLDPALNNNCHGAPKISQHLLYGIPDPSFSHASTSIIRPKTMAKTCQPYGGYEQEFVDIVSERFICQICTKVLADPHLTVCCGQHFCESCLKEWFEKHHKESCPHCRAEGEDFNHVINKGLRSEISQLKVRCSNWQQGKGCDWIGELGQLKHHLESEKGCGFVLVSCPSKCSLDKLKRMELDEHLRLRCILQPYKCEHCGFEDTYYAITGDVRRGKGFGAGCVWSVNVLPGTCHYDTYLEFPLACRNTCGAKNIKRKDMQHHLEECPLEKVECPFHEAGCAEKKIQRCQLDEHLASNQQAHVLKDYTETKRKLHDTEAKLSSAIATIKLLQHNTGASKGASSLIIDHLRREGDIVNIIVPNISKVIHSGVIWYSPPFFYREGYKLCLALQCHTRIVLVDHVSEFTYGITVTLCLLKGKYDQQLAWPMQEC